MRIGTAINNDLPLGFHLGEVVGFLASAGNKPVKGKVEDLEKAEGCLKGIIRKLKKDSEVIEISTL